MSEQQSTWWKRLLVMGAVSGLALATVTTESSFGQAKKTPAKTPAAPKSTGGAKKPAPAPVIEEDTSPPPPATGMNNLGDDALLGELSGRGLETLLVEAFKINKIPPAQQAGFRALRGLRQLTDKSKKLSQAQRQDMLRDAVSGLKVVEAQINDPRKLMEYSAILITEGAMRDVNLIEYWGETPATQARLKPVADAIGGMLTKAHTNLGKEKSNLEKRMKSLTDNVQFKQYEALESLENQALFNVNMSAYYQALALPRSPEGMAQREEIVNKAIEVLKKEFDNDESGVQAVVKNRMGKLSMAKGKYAEAKAFFNDVITEKTKPTPDANMKYEAMYFSVLCDLQSGEVSTATKELDELINWQQANLDKGAEVQKGVAAAAQMMRYRIALAESELSQGPDKAKYEKAAVDILLKLSEEQPHLRSIIYEQLVERVGNTQPVKGMAPLMLQALLSKARNELDAEKPKPQVLLRGVEACHELVARAATDKTINASLVESAAIFIPTFLEAAGKKIEAANAYIDFIEKNPKSQYYKGAFGSAGHLIVEDLHGKDSPVKGDQDVVAVYDRFLPIAIKPPFNKTNFAFDYAQSLRKKTPPKYKEAVTYFAMVPPTDTRHTSARYFQMITLTNMLDQRLPNKKPAIVGKEREQMVAQVLTLSDEVRKLYLAAAAKATDAKAKDFARLRIAGCTLTAAQIAADEQKDSKRVLQILGTFETDTEGLPGVAEMMNEVLFRRVKAYMDAGQDNQATETLLALLNKTGGQEGANIVLGLLQKLNDNYKKAEGSGDTASMAQIAKNRALLSGRLVDWAEKSTNADVKKFVYSYRVFDAESKLLAGRLNNDKDMVKAARDAFLKLDEPAMVDLYKKEIESNPKAVEDFKTFPHHRNVMLGLGLAQFELGDYKAAQEALSPLVQMRKLGAAFIEKTDSKTSETVYSDNETYWEATYKYYRSNVELYRADKGAKNADIIYDQTKTGLKQQYIINRHAGGERWGDEIEKLRAEIIPDFDPASIPVSTPASQPATTQDTQPVAQSKPAAAE